MGRKTDLENAPTLREFSQCRTWFLRRGILCRSCLCLPSQDLTICLVVQVLSTCSGLEKEDCKTCQSVQVTQIASLSLLFPARAEPLGPERHLKLLLVRQRDDSGDGSGDYTNS